MTRDDIIREMGWCGSVGKSDLLDRIDAVVSKAVAAEREACAIAGGAAADAGLDGHGVAAAIRARSKP